MPSSWDSRSRSPLLRTVGWGGRLRRIRDRISVVMKFVIQLGRNARHDLPIVTNDLDGPYRNGDRRIASNAGPGWNGRLGVYHISSSAAGRSARVSQWFKELVLKTSDLVSRAWNWIAPLSPINVCSGPVATEW